MAQTTAAIFGLALAAVSIGLNAARYPVVWQMTAPAPAARSGAESPPPDAAARPADTTSTASILEETAPSAPDEPRVEETAAPLENPPDAYDSPLPENPPAAVPATEEPLAPVQFASLPGKADAGPVAGEGLRRLPPVDRPGPPPVVSPSRGGAIPVYPSTGME